MFQHVSKNELKIVFSDSETKINLIDKIIEYYENNKILVNISNISKKDFDKINYWWL
jgi:3-hydroxymyristoyl/3-hydroxydecanoyl-(acyl carrier protein) dehydratase